MDDLQYSSDPAAVMTVSVSCFKPCYKWMTFNTKNYNKANAAYLHSVLNLVINGWPSIPKLLSMFKQQGWVLNLVINGWPSIQCMIII